MADSLNELRDLPPGWDSYDGKPVTGEAIRTAENLVFVPLSDGGIQIELHAGRCDLEVMIAPDGRVAGASFEFVAFSASDEVQQPAGEDR